MPKAGEIFEARNFAVRRSPVEIHHSKNAVLGAFT
jgi:hypothetical protein